MGSEITLQSAATYQSAFRVRPDVAQETAHASGLGFYGWNTPPMEGFELPESDALVLALHLGGSRRVRAVTDHGLSRSCSAPGLVTLLPPGRAAAFRTEGSISLVTLHIPTSAVALADSVALTRLTQRDGPRFAFRDSFVSSGMKCLMRAARSPRAFSADYFAAITQALLCHLAQAGSEGDQTDDRASVVAPRLGRISIAELLAQIDEQLAGKLGIDDLAQQAGLGRSAFTRGFREATGFSVHQYLDQRRIEAAKALLRETDLDLAWIAPETGYASQSHFTANFRKVTGCTPARFRFPH